MCLDKVAEEFILDHNAIPAFKGYSGFPNTLCASLNDQVVHGIPNHNPLNNGTELIYQPTLLDIDLKDNNPAFFVRSDIFCNALLIKKGLIKKLKKKHMFNASIS